MNNQEEYRTVEEYPGYQISNLGNLIDLNGYYKEVYINNNGHYAVGLKNKNNKYKSVTIHALVAVAFLNHIPNGNNLIVIHGDSGKLNNNLDNLKIVSSRSNIKKYNYHDKTSKYIGVSIDKKSGKYRARISIKGKQKNLGLFVDQLEAAEAYQLALSSI